jgi:hypothetical protein
VEIMKKIPVGATIAHAYRFAFGDFFKILGVMWLPLVIIWAPSLLMRTRMMALSAQFATHDFSGLREMWGVLLPLYLAAVVFLFMQMIGIARLALGLPRGSVWFYFSLGKPVWRLIGSYLLMIVAIIIGWLAVILGSVLIGFLVGLITKFVNNSAFGMVMAILAGLGMIFLWCGFLYCFVRLTFLLVPVVAAEEEGFALARSWTLGLGNFWRMFAILLAILVPFILLECIFVFGFMFKGVPFPPPHASADQAAAFQMALNANTLTMMNGIYHYWYISFPLTIAVMVVLYGMAVGAQCFAYRALTEGEASDPVAGD